MLGYLLAPLRDTLRPHFNLSKTRLATMAIILFGLANGRTVSLSHLASQFPGKALHASNYRRLQHFFKQVQFDEAVVARFIVSLLNIKGPVILAVDRTNWKLGKVDINILVLAIVTRRFKVPLICSFTVHDSSCSEKRKGSIIEETSNKDLQYAWIPPRPSARHITPAFQLEQDSIGHYGNNPVWSG